MQRRPKIKIGDIVQLRTDFNDATSEERYVQKTLFKVIDIEQGFLKIQKLDSLLAAIYVPIGIVRKASKAAQVLFS